MKDSGGQKITVKVNMKVKKPGLLPCFPVFQIKQEAMEGGVLSTNEIATQ